MIREAESCRIVYYRCEKGSRTADPRPLPPIRPVTPIDTARQISRPPSFDRRPRQRASDLLSDPFLPVPIVSEEICVDVSRNVYRRFGWEAKWHNVGRFINTTQAADYRNAIPCIYFRPSQIQYVNGRSEIQARCRNR